MRYLTEFRDEDANSPIIYARTKSGGSDFSSPPNTQPSAERVAGGFVSEASEVSYVPGAVAHRDAWRWNQAKGFGGAIWVAILDFPPPPFFSIFIYCFDLLMSLQAKQLGFLVPVRVYLNTSVSVCLALFAFNFPSCLSWWLLVCPGPMSFFICDRFGDSHLNKPSKIQYLSIPVIPFAGTFPGTDWVILDWFAGCSYYHCLGCLAIWYTFEVGRHRRGSQLPQLQRLKPSVSLWRWAMFSHTSKYCHFVENKDAEVRNYVPKALCLPLVGKKQFCCVIKWWRLVKVAIIGAIVFWCKTTLGVWINDEMVWLQILQLADWNIPKLCLLFDGFIYSTVHIIILYRITLYSYSLLFVFLLGLSDLLSALSAQEGEGWLTLP